MLFYYYGESPDKDTDTHTAFDMDGNKILSATRALRLRSIGVSLYSNADSPAVWITPLSFPTATPRRTALQLSLVSQIKQTDQISIKWVEMDFIQIRSVLVGPSDTTQHEL